MLLTDALPSGKVSSLIADRFARASSASALEMLSDRSAGYTPRANNRATNQGLASVIRIEQDTVQASRQPSSLSLGRGSLQSSSDLTEQNLPRSNAFGKALV